MQKTYIISEAPVRTARHWAQKIYTWADFCRRCRDVRRTAETAAQYAAMSREDRGRVKDVGGFVGGSLQGGRRKRGAVTARTLITLDIDYGTPDTWDEVQMSIDCAALLYSTHSHTDARPRFRLVIPLARAVSAEEYEPVARRVAERIGLALFDTTTYDTCRLFYWPSAGVDAPFVFHEQAGEPLNPDAVLATYRDWRDCAEWPASAREADIIRRDIKKAADPTGKRGIVGAFCRAHTIEDTVETLLADVYEPTTTPGRYTYKEGHVAGGLVCYQHLFAYSHHETDPASGQLCNAFDLVRIQRFGEADKGREFDDITQAPSYKQMLDFATDDRPTRVLLIRERADGVREDFAGVPEGDGSPTAGDKQDGGKKAAATGQTAANAQAWEEELEVGKGGKVLSTARNVILILNRHPDIAGRLWRNDFTGYTVVDGGLPWAHEGRRWLNSDDSNLRVWLEDKFGIVARDRIADALTAVVTARRRHPIREYLRSLVWDGTPRLDTAIIRLLGAEDTPVNRAFTRTHLCAAVARVMRPGCKYDQCLILAGPEGTGKSSFFGIMGGEWFNDSMPCLDNSKNAMENLRQGWILELAEICAVKGSAVESVKAFLSKTADAYRPAYGAHLEEYPRQCVFCGSTNETNFLRGDTGNRRMWVIEVRPELRQAEGGIREAIAAERDQLWAEAVQAYEAGQPLYLSGELEADARRVQADHSDNADDPLREQLEVFLNSKLPTEWENMGTPARHAFYTRPDRLLDEGTVERTRACVPEFLCEFVGMSMRDTAYKYTARRVAKMFGQQEGWEYMGTSSHTINIYGRQRAWRKMRQIEQFECNQRTQECNQCNQRTDDDDL